MSDFPPEGSRWRSKGDPIERQVVEIITATREMVTYRHIDGPKAPNASLMHPTQFFDKFEPVPSD